MSFAKNILLLSLFVIVMPMHAVSFVKAGSLLADKQDLRVQYEAIASMIEERYPDLM